jgi:hypothetical protein
VKSSAAAIPEDAMTMAAVRIGDGLGNLQAIVASPISHHRSGVKQYILELK